MSKERGGPASCPTDRTPSETTESAPYRSGASLRKVSGATPRVIDLPRQPIPAPNRFQGDPYVEPPVVKGLPYWRVRRMTKQLEKCPAGSVPHVLQQFLLAIQDEAPPIRQELAAHFIRIAVARTPGPDHLFSPDGARREDRWWE
jgi:hypothetical protein